MEAGSRKGLGAHGQFGRDEEFLARNTRFSDSLTDDFLRTCLIMIGQPFCKKKTIDGNWIADHRPGGVDVPIPRLGS